MASPGPNSIRLKIRGDKTPMSPGVFPVKLHHPIKCPVFVDTTLSTSYRLINYPLPAGLIHGKQRSKKTFQPGSVRLFLNLLSSSDKVETDTLAIRSIISSGVRNPFSPSKDVMAHRISGLWFASL